MQKLFIASGNVHKVAEFEALLTGKAIKVESASSCGGMPPVDETGNSFAANALLKAEALRLKAPEASWVMADDSGLEVDFLGGAPGVYSARYAGEQATDRQNLEKLLEALSEVSIENRTARFRCSLCLLLSTGEVSYFDGSCEGRILEDPEGEAGFGYDPVFVPEGYDGSFAVLGAEIKSQLSHRAAAIRAFCDWYDRGNYGT